jgi:Ca-activated chloride channel family protein
MTMDFGLWTKAENGMETVEVALIGVRITSKVTGQGQRTVVEQVFKNKERRPIEAMYAFPLPDGAAVCGFEAITGERVLTGVIEEIGAGMEKYDEAVAEGHGAFMAELWRPDVFSTRIGNIKPGQAVLIRLTYVADVDVHERKLRVSFPTTLAPRYTTSTAMDPVDAMPESDALNPPHVLAVPYGLELSVEIDSGLPLKSVGSPTHGVRVEHVAGNGAGTWKVTLAAAKTEMNRNVVIEAELAKETSAAGWIEDGIDGAEKFAAVTFLPEFEPAELGAVEPREIVFVLDCSGSMDGSSIEQARLALALCLKCLNEGDRFNICRFGSTHEFMQPESVPYTQRTLDAAMRYVNGINANLGGTELHAPLEAVLKGASVRQVREIILLTDGQVTNEPALVKMAGKYRGRARIFSFGIGPASSEYLVRGVAAATGGASTFIAPEERIEQHVLRMFARIASPRLDEIEVNWNGAEADMEPRAVAGLFDGEPLRVCARLRGNAPREVNLSAMWKGKRKTWTVPLDAQSARTSDKVGVIGATWARRRLAELEVAGESIKEKRRREIVVELSKRYGVLSKETTLIAIEHRCIEDRTKGKPATRRVPVMLAKGWGETTQVSLSRKWFDAAGCAAAPACSAPAQDALSFAVRRRKSEGAAGKFSLGTPMFSKAGPEGFPVDKDSARDRESANAHSDPLHDLLMRQRADGSFGWDDSLLAGQVGGKTWNPIATKASVEALAMALVGDVRQRVLGTAMTLRAFHECFPEQRDLWAMAEKKALRWLKRFAPTIGEWLDQAASAAPTR